MSSMDLMFALTADIEKNLTVSYHRNKTSTVDACLDRWRYSFAQILIKNEEPVLIWPNWLISVSVPLSNIGDSIAIGTGPP